jgi:hypothetical protein
MASTERVLEFTVDKQRITRNKDCDFSHIVAGSVGYLKAKFYFTSGEWKGCKKAASFWVNGKESAVLLDKSNTCLIPSEVLVGTKFEVSVTGIKNNLRISTNHTKVKQEVR